MASDSLPGLVGLHGTDGKAGEGALTSGTKTSLVEG